MKCKSEVLYVSISFPEVLCMIRDIHLGMEDGESQNNFMKEFKIYTTEYLLE